jgi:hypothetical protein
MYESAQRALGDSGFMAYCIPALAAVIECISKRLGYGFHVDTIIEHFGLCKFHIQNFERIAAPRG